MRKIALIFLFIFLSFQSAKARYKATLAAIIPKQDTMLFYMKNSGGFVNNKDSADYFLFIMPPDSSSGFYPIYEYFPNGKTKLVGSSSTNQYNKISFEGVRMEYFPNGRRESYTTYKAGKLCGNFVYYFPNGKVYTIGNVTEKGQRKLIECRDSIGNILTENGNGKWINFDSDFKSIVIQGSVKDSLKEGEWDGMDGERIACVDIYKHGNLVSGTYYFKSGKKYQFYTDDVEPTYANGGPAGFNTYLAKAVVYPVPDRDGKSQGKVVATFVIEKDGTLSNIKIVRSPTDSMAAEIVRVIKASPPWIPGIQNGVPVRVQFTISFNFSVEND